MIKKTTYFIGLGLGVLILGFLPTQISAYRIEDMGFIGPPAGDFSIGPGKTELWMDPGDKVTKEISIINRIGRIMNFIIEIEDFRGSNDPERTVVLLGDERGPYSLKDYLHPEIMEFTLKHGERMILPIEISIPEDAEPGGLYGSVLVRNEAPGPGIEIEKQKAASGVKVISRLGTLFFIRVKGDVKEDGFLEDFKTTKDFYEKGPIPFEILFKNNGSTHLIPYGLIEIKNILGRKIEEIELEPWFAMPDSLRLREVNWERGLLLGRYTANLKVNRGYKDIIDEESITFWVIPWKIILAGLIILVVAIWLLIWIASHFEIRKKSKPDQVS